MKRVLAFLVSFFRERIVLFFENHNNDFNVDSWWELRERVFSTKSVLKKCLLTRKYNKICNSFNSFIPLRKEIFAGKPIFPHGINGVFISSNARIGLSCVIFHQVTIGSNTLVDSPNKGAPSIGDNVYIGCGAKIIGNATVGNNVRIGANCVIVNDVDPLF